MSTIVKPRSFPNYRYRPDDDKGLGLCQVPRSRGGSCKFGAVQIIEGIPMCRHHRKMRRRVA